MVPASAATLLSQAGHNVVWDDGIAEGNSYEKWLRGLETSNSDIIMMETKTPVVRKHWKIAEDIKKTNHSTKIVLVGDHVTALPRESLEKSPVDYVLTGGDYDFLLLNLVSYLEGKARALEPGIWYREGDDAVSSGAFDLHHDLNTLPHIDRDLTKWSLYAYKNGNFKSTPGTYTMVGRDCWWRHNGGCTFCSWPTLYPVFRTKKPELLIDEIGTLIEKYGIKEIFDDTGTFPAGQWLKDFCNLMIKHGYNKKVSISCNMRFGVLSSDDYKLMKKAGFRMLLFGLESANQSTLDRLNKGVTVENIVEGSRSARAAGLEPHITVMVGYPWEKRDDALATLKLAKMLLEKGMAITLQSTVVIPYPGTTLYREALENGWFTIDPQDYDRFDMSQPILRTPDLDPSETMKICDDMYRIFLSPRYILGQLCRMRSIKDLKYSIRGLKKVSGHARDFEHKRSS
jgi:radical SAM superfamily enzyme YgiQ (UPF0313 family)